jgi:hypothetical protein
MAQYAVILKNYLNIFEEFLAGGTIYPGMFLHLNSSGAVVAHNDDAPANQLVMVAVEDALQGRDINDPYVTGDPVKVFIPQRGDEVYAILEDGANVAVGAFLESNGAGFLQAVTTGKAVAVALEAVDLSGSSGEESSLAPLGYNKRIKVKIL